MKKANGPVKDFSHIKAVIEDHIASTTSDLKLDFDNTEKTFSHLSDGELKRSARLFSLMNKAWLTNILSPLGMISVKYGLPGAEWIMKKTIYSQFVGGTSLLAAEPAIRELYRRRVSSVLDYGAEAKNEEEDFNFVMKEIMKGVEFAARNEAVPVVVAKISSMARNKLLEAFQQEDYDYTPEMRTEYTSLQKRLNAICNLAAKLGVKIFFDAEESWIQDTLDKLVTKLMERYNKEKVIVYNTFQLYRHDRLDYLINSHEKARREGYLLGAKLVRGAYMNKERERAAELGYSSPIQPNIEATHKDFNTAIRYCLDHYEELASCNASHNRESVELQARLIEERGLPRNHDHLNFCQLYGMSDNLTFNLAEAGYNVAKYLVYGPVTEVTPYLIRRAQENSSVTGDVGRELGMIRKELKRRGL
ncbi:proline dehydrogenase [Lewinellaceae bacterium SD302]|nr:proline dehydrogenase [Lewinellaceae bacterium SD302]